MTSERFEYSLIEISISIEIQTKEIDDFPDDEEYSLREVLMEAIEKQDIGKVFVPGSGIGWLEFSFRIHDKDRLQLALQRVRQLLEEFSISTEQTTVRVSYEYEYKL